jgi:hypothetical protein
MRQLYRILLGVALVCAMLTGTAWLASAQNATTGTLTGVVMDAQKGVLPGATVVAVHTPTGTTYEAVTQADGHFTMLSVRVGGPYTIKATMSGFKTEEKSGVNVGLGESRLVDFTLAVAAVTETVNVVAEAQIIDTTRAGTAANIAPQAIESLPTIQRSITDFARTSPFFNVGVAAANDNNQTVSVAGRNNRYNNMQIDGAVNNDVFGLSDSGTPGGQTGTQPVSLDAIQEIQLVVSPYDVRQGGFSGGGINAVTKSGTNALHGTAYYFGRSQRLVGSIPGLPSPKDPNPADIKLAAFSDKQFGGSVGGPIVQNKAFFFGNYDRARKLTPSGWAADGSASQQFANPTLAQQVLDVAKSQYGFNGGDLSEVSRPNDSDKVFARVDFNVKNNHQLTVRTNYVDGSFWSGSSSLNSYNFLSHYYDMTDKMLSTVGQLNSSFGSAFNELRVVYSRERNVRGIPPGFVAFPEVQVYSDNLVQSVTLGAEYSSQANKLNQDIIQVSDDITLVKGQHTFSLGTQNEFYKFWNLFIQNAMGSYVFKSLADFQTGVSQGYRHYFSNTSDPNQAADFSVRQFGFYAGDKWRARSNFTLTYGMRVDLPRFPDTPHANPKAVANYGYATDIVPSPTMWSGRAGFNWDLSSGSGKRAQVRGGFGLFTGRTPYVWLSNQYGNTGVDFTNLSAVFSTSTPTRYSIPFVADPDNQPTSFPGATVGTMTINMIDPNYKYPEILRGNIAFDRDLGFWGLYATAEFLFTNNLKDIAYKNVNFIPTGSVLPDYQPTVKKLDSTVADAMLLTNTDQGKTYTAVIKVERPFRNGFYASGSYMYGRAWSINDGTSSVARSNWTGVPIDGDTNNPQLSRSNYDVGSRVNFAFTMPIPMGTKKVNSAVSLFYNGQHGRPYSLGFSGDANGDLVSQDLLFVPVSADQIIVSNGTWDQLNTYLSNDPAASQYRGMIMPRNAGRSPWSNQLDFRYALNVPFAGSKRAEITVDVFNFLNLLNKDWGWQYTAGFPGFASVIRYAGLDAATNKMKYDLSTITSQTFQGTFYRDDLRSRWQAQIGARFRF